MCYMGASPYMGSSYVMDGYGGGGYAGYGGYGGGYGSSQYYPQMMQQQPMMQPMQQGYVQQPQYVSVMLFVLSIDGQTIA